MQIEETFRDMKDERWGFGIAQARCGVRMRREVLLLIGALALLLLWLVARGGGWARHSQANTERARAVLSLVFLGREVLRHPGYRLDPDALAASDGPATSHPSITGGPCVSSWGSLSV